MKRRSTEKPDRSPPGRTARRNNPAREALIAAIGSEVVRSQDASNSVDNAAAAVLALERSDLQCISMLLFMGPSPRERIAGALRLTPRVFRAMLERIELAGYTRRIVTRDGDRIELTEHAR